MAPEPPIREPAAAGTRGRFCYIVLAHTDPAGVLRLVRRIRRLSPTCEVVVRHHRPEFIDAAAVRAAGAIPLRSRVDVRWGDWTQVQMVLGALAFARAASDADWFVDISGQDYPIRDLAAWEQEVRRGGIDALLCPLPAQPWTTANRWWVRTQRRTGLPLVDRAARYALNRAGEVLDPLAFAHSSGRPDDDRFWVGVPRRRPPPIPVTKCAQWMTLSAAAVDAVLERDRHDGRVRRFFEHTKLPDEVYLASLLHDTAGLRIGHGETSAQLFRGGQGSPQWVDLEVLAALRRSSAAPFVRKIPPAVSPQVLRDADELAARPVAQVWAEAVEPGRLTDAHRWPAQVRAAITPTLRPAWSQRCAAR